MIMAGEILTGDRPIKTSGERLSVDIPLRWRPRRGHGYVGRGGLKMEGALRRFKVVPKGAICLDLGMSTGGFTDCLLQWGAERVYGVDVGRGLAHRRLITDPRVKVIEGTHIRDLTVEDVPELCTLCVADLSFNSLSRLIAPALPFLAPNAIGILLVKPQFELTSAELKESSFGGVVHDVDARLKALDRVQTELLDMGWRLIDRGESETKGTKGNQEYFLHLIWSPQGSS
jgi:23S rRNA (cytidine1920-2'-O)/16S rRNA (cytidine1409-2'-O)-methyltransferase